MNAVQSIDLWTIAVVITIPVLAGFAFFARWCGFSPAVHRRKLEQLCVGMTMEEVKAMLGLPREQTNNTNGVSQWVYGARVKRNILIIEFNSKGILQSFAHGVPDTRRAAASARNS